MKIVRFISVAIGCIFSLHATVILADTLDFYNISDTYVTGSLILGPDDVNYGSATKFTAGRNTHLYSYSLIRVEDLIGTSAGQINSETDIISAELHVWLDLSWGKADAYYGLFQLTKDWQEDTVTATYGNVTSVSSGTAIDTLVAPSANPYTTNTEYVFDVTASLSDWITGTANYGWGLVANSARNEFFSSESGETAYLPYLTVQTGDPVPEPTTLILFSCGVAGIASLRLREKFFNHK